MENNASEPHRKCILHLEQTQTKEGIISFNEITLKKCNEAQLVYQSRSNSKFHGIIVPPFLDNASGYHPKCYKKYTAVKSGEKNAVLENISIHSNGQSSQSGIYRSLLRTLLMQLMQVFRFSLVYRVSCNIHVFF